MKTTIHADVVTVTENTFMDGTNKYPKFMASVSVEAMQSCVDNIYRLIESVENHKENMLKMKDTLVKERGEGIGIKIKQAATLSEKERLQREYQALETKKASLEV